MAIIGESKDGVVLTSDVFSPNGAWSSQDHISVWGDNVTIENLTIKPKLQTNKAIEVMGKDFKMCIRDRSSPTGVGLTSDWIVETQVELTEEMVSRDGIRVSIWLAVQGSNNFGGNHWAGVIDWSILQFKKDSTEDMAGWQAWNLSLIHI